MKALRHVGLILCGLGWFVVAPLLLVAAPFILLHDIGEGMLATYGKRTRTAPPPETTNAAPMEEAAPSVNPTTGYDDV